MDKRYIKMDFYSMMQHKKFYDPFEGEFGKLKLNADFPVGMKFSK